MLRLRGACGPSHDGASAPRDPPWCSCVCGNRESSYASACSAGTSVSQRLLSFPISEQTLPAFPQRAGSIQVAGQPVKRRDARIHAHPQRPSHPVHTVDRSAHTCSTWLSVTSRPKRSSTRLCKTAFRRRSQRTSAAEPGANASDKSANRELFLCHDAAPHSSTFSPRSGSHPPAPFSPIKVGPGGPLERCMRPAEGPAADRFPECVSPESPERRVGTPTRFHVSRHCPQMCIMVWINSGYTCK